MNEPDADVQTRLQTLFADAIHGLYPCWEPCEWSRVYRLALRDGTRLFVKGTPRSRNEALVMHRLHALCSTSLPRVLVVDLVPAATWRWFLMEDAGCCDQSALSRPLAIEAARILGQLQQRALHDQVLSSWLTRCEGSHLQQHALAVCRWAMNQQACAALDDLQRIVSRLQEARAFFGDLAQQLAQLPSTIVHGDFWSGNIAVAGTTLRLIDWGDALWGVGGVSLVNLVLTSDGQLDQSTKRGDKKRLDCSLKPPPLRVCSRAVPFIYAQGGNTYVHTSSRSTLAGWRHRRDPCVGAHLPSSWPRRPH